MTRAPPSGSAEGFGLRPLSRRRNLAFCLSLALLLISALSQHCGCGRDGPGDEAPQGPLPSGPKPPAAVGEDPVWVVVNGRELRRSEVELESKLLFIGFHSRSAAAQNPELKRAAMQVAVEKALLDQEVERLNIELGPDELESELERVRAQAPGEGEFERKLAALEIGPDDFVKLVRRELLHESLIARFIPADEPSEEELREFYEKRKSWLTEPARAHVRDIFLMVPAEASAAERAKRKKLAGEILRKLHAGEEFIALTQKYSDSPTRVVGGRDVFVKGSLSPEFDEAVFSLEPGELSDVIELAEGFHIVLMGAVIPEQTTPFERVRDMILGYLKEERRRQARIGLLERLKSEARIEYLEPPPPPHSEGSARPAPAADDFPQ